MKLTFSKKFIRQASIPKRHRLEKRLEKISQAIRYPW